MRAIDTWYLDNFLDAVVRIRVLDQGAANGVAFGFADVL